MNRQAKHVKQLWPGYRAAILHQGMPHARAAWLVRWAQRFARTLPGVPLRSRTAAHVQAFLSTFAQPANIEPWQVEQGQEALQVLDQQCLPLPWARPWPLRAHAREIAGGSAPGTSFRDEVGSPEVEARHPVLLIRLRTAMRARHYALRTALAYEHWIRRVVTFHRPNAPRELGPEAVKEYLEYGAEARQVAASTQNQALHALVFLDEQVRGALWGTQGELTRAKRPKRLPVVLTREDVNRLLDALPGTSRLMAGLLYGRGFNQPIEWNRTSAGCKPP